MRKMLSDELEFFMNIPDKPNQKLTKKQISRIEEKENFIAYCNQYSHIYMRYVELQESNKMSSKHNTSKNLLFSNLPSNLQFKSFKVGDLIKQNSISNTYANRTLDKFSFSSNITPTIKTHQNNTNMSSSKMKYGINFVNNHSVMNINKEVLDSNNNDSEDYDNNLIKENNVSNSTNNSNMIPFSVKRDVEEEQELKKKIKEIANKKNVKGLTSICINRDNRKLLVNSMSNTQYIYDCLYWDKIPPIELKGHKSSFCVKSVLSPNTDYALSGSSDASIYIWNISNVEASSEPIKLTGFHNMEIGAVDWGRNNENFIVSACDNGIVLIWDDK